MSLPPQTPIGLARSAQTQHKTPLRTPLRTPGGGEQLSHTPVINFAAIEAHKENVQPLVGGRSAHALSNALSQRHAELKVQRKAYEEQVQSRENQEADDPLEAWTQYVKWCIDSYPSGQTSESDLVLVLERCTRTFRYSAQYKNDSRYLRMWILYARNVDCPGEVYNFLLANEVGTSLASLYEELAAVYEGQAYFDKADETFRLGVHRTAQPIERLKRRFSEFQQRIVTQEGTNASASDQRTAYKEALKIAMQKAQRSMLGTKAGSTSLSANSVRGMGGQAGLSKVSGALSSGNNARKPGVFKDADGDDVFARPNSEPASQSVGWADVGTAASRKQEKVTEHKPWKGEVLPQREAGTTPKRPVIAVYRDSDDEDDKAEADAGRTPGRVNGDVFSKVREPSETDRLRRNPFANYDEDVRKEEKAPFVQEKGPRATSSTAQVKEKKISSSTKSSHSAKTQPSGSSQKVERYAAPLKRLYPGLDLELAVKRTSRKHKSGEVCLEELIALRYLPSTSSEDPWAHLDAMQGKWLPEIKPPAKPKTMKRDPTVTAFTKAAQEDVMQMFNGAMVESDEESEDEPSESEDEDEVERDAGCGNMMMKENECVPPTPTPVSRNGPSNANGKRLLDDTSMLSTNPMATSSVHAIPARKIFGGDRRPLGMRQTTDLTSSSDSHASSTAAPMPQRVTAEPFDERDGDEDDDEDSVMEDGRGECGLQGNDDDEMDYLNRPMRELAPLSPITEATEYTRFTQSTRTPHTNSTGRLSHAWTPTADGRGHESFEEGDESSYGALPSQSRPSLPQLEKQGQSDVDQDVFDQLPNPICPFDDQVIQSILANLSLPLESSNDYVNLSSQTSDALQALQKRAATQAKSLRRSSSQSSVQQSSTSNASEWTLNVGGHSLVVRQKLGEGGYGAVFLVEDRAGLTGRQQMVGGINGDASFADLEPSRAFDASTFDDDDDDDNLEPRLMAVKVETPPNRWEFYILGQLRARLTDQTRLSSIVCARKFFCYKDESFLLLEYAEKGTLLEIVNNAIKAGVASSSALAFGGAQGGAGAGSVGVDEILAMFFVVEVIKIVEALHAVDLLHGDLKIDNCLLRLDDDDRSASWTHAYDRQGGNGWSTKGITLIDFGRAIDLRQFSANHRFVADWAAEEHDMPQIHQGASWRKEIDYYGIASIAYCLLFGKYIGYVASARSDGKDDEQITYSIDKPLRRYWQVDVWSTLFHLCLNSHALPTEQEAAERLADVRMRMEQWLEENCFRAGKNLKGSLKKLEIWSMKRTMY